MDFFKLKTSLSQIQKICLAGIFTALVAVFQKVLAINYVPGLPFVRLSFGGPALIIFSSILLGPWYGLLVGAASDVLGYFIFDMSSFGWFPQITVIYAVLGFVSYFVFGLIRHFDNKKKMILTEIVAFIIFIASIVLFLIQQDVDLWIKIVIPSIALVLGTLCLVMICFLNKKIEPSKKLNLFQISFASFILDVVVLLAFGTLMKSFAFGFESYLLIFTCQAFVLFFNILIDTIVLSLMLKLTNKYFIED